MQWFASNHFLGIQYLLLFQYVIKTQWSLSFFYILSCTEKKNNLNLAVSLPKTGTDPSKKKKTSEYETFNLILAEGSSDYICTYEWEKLLGSFTLANYPDNTPHYITKGWNQVSCIFTFTSTQLTWGLSWEESKRLYLFQIPWERMICRRGCGSFA